ncbi:NAD(P)-dependent oxidoreductase [Allosalinactinospora lopnorensis]|uniref:NAD(P)-dependent oxidoreductase n=1 Tax=Allosalinactinospora lopnorensis TaxID=1352348 RepID=UPI000623EE71|nr:NAD(P)-dependent oxidoreductase [Allosalinactinospora lopnorensis]
MRIGFLGLGRMGALMARRLADHGYDLAVWNRTASRTEDFLEAGAKIGGTPVETAAGRDLVITMLADPTAVDDTFFGPEGAAAGLSPGAMVVEMSTVGPSAIAKLRERLPSGTRLADGPVLGSLPQASAGELKIFLGGSAEDIEVCREPLSVLGTPHHVGGLGDGAAMKLAANLSFITSIVTIGEAVKLADHLGLDPETTLDVLSETPMGALVTRLRDRITAAEAPPTAFALGLAEKDLALALTEGAHENGVVAAARAQLAAGRAAGLDDQDVSSVVRFLRQ